MSEKLIPFDILRSQIRDHIAECREFHETLDYWQAAPTYLDYADVPAFGISDASGNWSPLEARVYYRLGWERRIVGDQEVGHAYPVIDGDLLLLVIAGRGQPAIDMTALLSDEQRSAMVELALSAHVKEAA